MPPSVGPEAFLPSGLCNRLEAAMGARVVDARPRGGGGASRFGAELTFEREGARFKTYLAYNAGRAETGGEGLGSAEAFEREAGVLAALSGPLEGSGVRVARLLAADRPTRGILTAFVDGEANYNRLTDRGERDAVSRDFMAQLATLHRIDVQHPSLAVLKPQRPAADIVRERIRTLRSSKLRHIRDPLIALALNWLEDNLPANPERNVVLHGDAGPANFLFADGRVTALLDWELTHAGDPHADLAMIAIRNLFQPFIPLKDAFAAYEAAGGIKVDLDRVRYYRAFFQVQFASPPEAMNLPNAPAPTVFGTNLVYATVHMRVLAQALAEAMAVTLDPVHLPDAPAGPHARSFEAALDDLRGYIVPRLEDQEASAKAKGLARLVKWWRDLERWGASFERQELNELRAVLGSGVVSVAEGRARLTELIMSRSIDSILALQLCNAQVTRASHLYADAMGAFSGAKFSPLD